MCVLFGLVVFCSWLGISCLGVCLVVWSVWLCVGVACCAVMFLWLFYFLASSLVIFVCVSVCFLTCWAWSGFWVFVLFVFGFEVVFV